MLRAYCLLLLLLLSMPVMAKPRLTIDKMDDNEIGKASKEIGFSALLEGTVDDPKAMVFVIVSSPGEKTKHSFPAAVESMQPDAKGGYRWHAICQFGTHEGLGVGASYQVRAVALNRNEIKKTGNIHDSISEKNLQSDTLTIKRVKK
jgi:hypothetical protein